LINLNYFSIITINKIINCRPRRYSQRQEYDDPQGDSRHLVKNPALEELLLYIVQNVGFVFTKGSPRSTTTSRTEGCDFQFFSFWRICPFLNPEKVVQKLANMEMAGSIVAVALFIVEKYTS